MKLSKISLAVAALCASPAAFALTPAQIAAGPTTYIWLSGNSAPSNGIFRSVLSLCNGVAGNGGTNDAHMYLESTGTEPGKSSGDRTAYACTMSAAAGSALSGKKVVVYHTVEGGSFNAFAPHLAMAGEVNPFLTPTPYPLSRIHDLATQGTCAVAAPTNVTLNTVTSPIGRFTGCNLVTKTFTAATPATLPGQNYPDGGFSDTEYQINKLNLGIDTALSTIGNEVATNIGQAFGVGVSYPLYFQLQKNDVTDGKLPASCTTGHSAAAPDLTAACQPNMPAQRYTAIANQDSIDGQDGGTTFGGAPGSKINLVRRVPTSGTQSASNIRFLATPCASGVPQGQLFPARAGAYAGGSVIVTEQSSTGGVKTALNTASLANEFALGVVSMENTPAPTVNTDRWAFVKLDRADPDPDAQQRAEAMDGSYTFWYEMSAFTAGGTHPASAGGADLIAKVASTMGEHDLKGIFATPLAGAGGPTSKGARAGNSCQPAVQ